MKDLRRADEARAARAASAHVSEDAGWWEGIARNALALSRKLATSEDPEAPALAAELRRVAQVCRGAVSRIRRQQAGRRDA